jgi:hypothetical protein
MTNVLLISEQKLRQFTDINDNLDTAFLKNAVREAQDIHLQRSVGTRLYKKLQQDVINNDLAGVYKELMDDYLQDFLLYAAYYESLEAIYIRPRNNGLLNATGGDNSESVNRSLYDVKRQSVNNKLQYYSERLTNFLIEKQNEIVELNTNTFLYEQNPDYGVKYQSPIVFKDTNRGRRYKGAKKAGLRITDSRYPQFPGASNIK